MSKYDVFGLGNALMDILIKVDDSHLAEFNLKKGVFHLLEKEKIDEILKKHQSRITKHIPAGSATNTLMGLANLGVKCVLCGKVGKDVHGDFYEEILVKDNIKCHLHRCHQHATGRVLNFITPDAERTFAVNLGAAINLQKHELIDEDLKESKLLHFTGYELESNKDVALHALKIAQENKVKFSFDVADPHLVKRNLAEIKKLIQQAEIVFMNENEAKALTGLEPEQAAQEVGKTAKIAVVKIGNKGSFVYSQGKMFKIQPFLKKAIDTTGAGDLYAAGFIYGWLNQKPLELCGKYGSYMASKIVEVIGGRLECPVKGEIDKL